MQDVAVRMAQALGRLELSASQRQHQAVAELLAAFRNIGGSQRQRAATLLEELAQDLTHVAEMYRREIEMDGGA